MALVSDEPDALSRVTHSPPAKEWEADAIDEFSSEFETGLEPEHFYKQAYQRLSSVDSSAGVVRFVGWIIALVGALGFIAALVAFFRSVSESSIDRGANLSVAVTSGFGSVILIGVAATMMMLSSYTQMRSLEFERHLNDELDVERES